MLKITWKALPNRIRITIVHLYTHIFIKIDFLEISTCPRGELAKIQSKFKQEAVMDSRCPVSDNRQANSDDSMWGHQAVVL